ncbi:OmpA family protein [Nonlabens marinus]|uniref:Outer membrane protein n=1 Tax=Nonlabens marinus S1-08 TaxID=1454201 RepID=W8VP42_9FLAO|nr:OmpA family protein [Nonlabens marinus]BAO54819.1 outer membrane protein [Nonlabens marinus S1-08]
MKSFATLVFTICFVAISSAQLTVEHSIYFDLDKYSLKQSELDAFDAFFKDLLYLPILDVEILGYCDDRGTIEYNQKLSENRVETVAMWLLDHDINLMNIYKEVAGKGEVALDKNSAQYNLIQARAQNRRVDVRFRLEEPAASRLAIPTLLKKDLTAEQRKVIPEYEEKVIYQVRKKSNSDELIPIEDLDEYIYVPTSISPPVNNLEEPFKSLLRKNISSGETIILEDIHFLRGRSTLNPESIPLVKRVIEILQARPNVHFEIHGHVCCIDPRFEDALDRNTMRSDLSYARAKLIYRILLEYQIEPQRMAYRGFGRTKPLGGTDQEDRRVELYITKVE